MEIKVLSVNGLETRYGFTISSEVVPRVVSIDKLVSYWISIILIEIVDIVIVVKEVPFDLLTTIIEVVKATIYRLKAMKRFTELSRDRREAIGKAGREKMEKEFDKNQVVEETVKVITGNRSKQERGRL